MQIDTWNRDEMELTGSAFVPGPYPKRSGDSKWPAGNLAPVNGSDATYSGLLECPLTTRIRKKLTGGGWNDSFAANIDCNYASSCPQKLQTPSECFAAAREIGISQSVSVVTSKGTSDNLPSGCSVEVNDTHAHVFFNINTKSSACCGAGVDTVEGTQQSLVTLGLTLSSSVGATITMTGPADNVWFGVGFDTHVMSNSPYTITVDGKGQVTERVLGDHAPGVVLNSSIKVISHSVSAGKRTVVLSRSLHGLTPQHHDFDPQKLSLDFISAVGSGPDFGFHKAKTASTISLWPKTPAASKGGTFGFFRANVATHQLRNDWSGEVCVHGVH